MNVRQCLILLQQYQNEVLLQSFLAKNTAIDAQHCQQILQDVCAWLALKEWRALQGKETYLFGPLLILDELWHAFILHTRDYHAFCAHYFGHYVHHHVEPAGAEHRLTAEELADYFADCFEYLGEEWVRRYFGEMLDTP